MIPKIIGYGLVQFVGLIGSLIFFFYRTQVQHKVLIGTLQRSIDDLCSDLKDTKESLSTKFEESVSKIESEHSKRLLILETKVAQLEEIKLGQIAQLTTRSLLESRKFGSDPN